MSCPELDRFGGKTHLISKTTYGPSGGSCAEVSPRTSATASVVDVSTPGGPVPMDSIHPTIMSDMRSFESGQFSAEDIARALNFDLPQFEQQQGPLQPQVNGNGNHPEYRAYPDIYMGEDIFGSVPTPSAFSTATSSSTSTPESITNVSAPVLDATWQSFVEQLGF